jgi:hypothetical protein
MAGPSVNMSGGVEEMQAVLGGCFASVAATVVIAPG